MVNALLADLLITLCGITMFAYGILTASIIGNYGYLSVLFCGIFVFSFLLIRHRNLLQKLEVEE